jgi:hypothetical protein
MIVLSTMILLAPLLPDAKVGGMSILTYTDCQIRAENELDDRKADISAVANAVASKCAQAYWGMIAFETKGARSKGFISNYDFALATVQTQRSYDHTSPEH